MKFSLFFVFSLFCSYSFANSDIPNNAMSTPSAEKTIPTAKKQADSSSKQKLEVKKLASSAKRDFENKVKNAWRMPAGSSGQSASARVTLNDSGSVATVHVNASDPDVKASVESAIRYAAPYPMPSDPEARRKARIFNANFTAK